MNVSNTERVIGFIILSLVLAFIIAWAVPAPFGWIVVALVAAFDLWLAYRTFIRGHAA